MGTQSVGALTVESGGTPFLRSNKTKWTGYLVRGHQAVDALAKKDRAAAQWWKENAPHVLGRFWGLSFPTDVCRIVER